MIKTSILFNGLKIYHSNTHDAEYAGSYCFTISSDMFKILYEHVENTEYLKDEMDEVLENSTDDVTLSNADLFIVMCALIINEEIDTEIFSEGAHVFWIWHDICHALNGDNDFILSSETFTAHMERDRLICGAELAMVEGKCSYAEVTSELFSNAKNFKTRFNEPLFENAHVYY